MRSVQSSFSIMLPFDLFCVLPAAKATRGQNQQAGCYRRSPRGAQTAKWGEICRQGTDRHWCSTQGEGHQSSWSPWKIPTSKILFTYHMPTFLVHFFKTNALPLRRFAQPLPWAMGGAESAGIWALNNAIAWSCHYFNYAQPLETSLWISSIFNQTIPILALVEGRLLMCCYLSKIFPIQDIWTICKLWWGQWTIEGKARSCRLRWQWPKIVYAGVSHLKIFGSIWTPGSSKEVFRSQNWARALWVTPEVGVFTAIRQFCFQINSRGTTYWIPKGSCCCWYRAFWSRRWGRCQPWASRRQRGPPWRWSW